jgi:hypothetical protein
MLLQEQVDSAIGDVTTKLPAGLPDFLALRNFVGHYS